MTGPRVSSCTLTEGASMKFLVILVQLVFLVLPKPGGKHHLVKDNQGKRYLIKVAQNTSSPRKHLQKKRKDRRHNDRSPEDCRLIESICRGRPDCIKALNCQRWLEEKNGKRWFEKKNGKGVRPRNVQDEHDYSLEFFETTFNMPEASDEEKKSKIDLHYDQLQGTATTIDDLHVADADIDADANVDTDTGADRDSDSDTDTDLDTDQLNDQDRGSEEETTTQETTFEQNDVASN